MILYPQLGHGPAAAEASAKCRLSVAAAAEAAGPAHADAVYTPTGGARASRDDLVALRGRVVALAAAGGYPDGGTEATRLAFDAAAAEALHGTMELAPAEASKLGVWAFLGCVLLPDVVRWRFPGGADGSPPERFLAGRRNTFQRLWWRGFVFHDEHAPAAGPPENSHRGSYDGPYGLLHALGEDEIVQIMERPFLAGSRALSQAVARGLLEAAGRHPAVNRRTLIREAQKRVRRLGAFTSFEAVDAEALAPFLRAVFDDVARAGA